MWRFSSALGICLIAFYISLGSAFAVVPEGAFEPIPVPSVTLYPGDILTSQHLTTRNYRSSWIAKSAIVVVPKQALGLVVTRTLPKGRPIALRWLGQPQLIKQGQDVVVMIESQGLKIQAVMKALEGGPLDATIRLRNPDSGAILSGRVRGAGLVDVMR